MISLKQHSFAGGQLDRALLGGRQDLQKYYIGASRIENYIVKRQGCVSKRSGTDYCFDATGRMIYTSDGEVTPTTSYRLVGFIFEKTYGYAILFTPGRITIYTKDGVTPQEIDTSPYTDGEIENLGICQSGDTLYIASKYHVPHKLIRNADGTFTLQEITFSNALPVPAVASLTVTNPTSGTPDRTISYVVSAVFESGESLSSAPAEVTYKSPWASGMIIKVTVTPTTTTPLYYNIYKKTQNYYGIIGSTMNAADLIIATASAATVTEKQTNATSTRLWSQPLWDTDAECKAVFSSSAMTKWGYKRGAVVVLSGDLALTLTSPVCFQRIRIGLGYCTTRKYLHHRNESLTNYTAHKTTLYATRARKHSVVVTFETGNPVTIDSALFDQIDGGAALDEIVQNPDGLYHWDLYGEAPYAPYEAQAYSNMTLRPHKIYIDIDMPAGEVRKATGITIKGYTDNAKTVPCTGDISYTTATHTPLVSDRYPEYIYTPSITGAPMIINGVELLTVGGSVLTFTDDYITPNVAMSPPNQTELFKPDGELPGLVTLYQQRLMFASSLQSPSKYWFSRPGSLEDFSSSDVITEADPIIASLPLTSGPRINHIIAQRDVHLFCESGEWNLKPTSGNSLSYKTIQTQMQSAAGSADWLPPLPCGTSMLFVEKSGRSVREYKYDYSNDGFAGRDISIVSASLFDGVYIVDWAYQQHPDSIVWCVMSDGTLRGFTYMPEHEVYAWFKCSTGNSGQVLAICSTDALIGYGGIDNTSEIFVLVKRGTSYFIERIRPETATETLVSRILRLDCCSEFTATQGQTIPTGYVAINKATGAQVTALVAGTIYIKGIPIVSTLQTIHPEIPNSSSIQHTKKALVSSILRVQDSEDLAVRVADQTSGSAVQVPNCNATITPAVAPATEANVALANGDFEVIPTQQNADDARLTIVDDGLYGSTILGVTSILSIQNLDGSEG